MTNIRNVELTDEQIMEIGLAQGPIIGALTKENQRLMQEVVELGEKLTQARRESWKVSAYERFVEALVALTEDDWYLEERMADALAERD